MFFFVVNHSPIEKNLTEYLQVVANNDSVLR